MAPDHAQVVARSDWWGAAAVAALLLAALGVAAALGVDPQRDLALSAGGAGGELLRLPGARDRAPPPPPLVLVFSAGALPGTAGMATWVHQRLAVLHAAGPEGSDALALQVLGEQLDLDAAQKQQARAILRRAHVRLVAFHHDHAGELHGIPAEAADELQALLEPGQAADWAAIHVRILTHLMISGSLHGPVHGKDHAEDPQPAEPHAPGR